MNGIARRACGWLTTDVRIIPGIPVWAFVVLAAQFAVASISVLAGWLFLAAQFTVAIALTVRRRRQRRTEAGIAR